MCEDRGRWDGDGCCSGLGSSTVAVASWGAPNWRCRGSHLGSPVCCWSQEMETNPFLPCWVQSKSGSKAAENPGFPFLFGTGMGETQGRRWMSHRDAAPPFPTAQGSMLPHPQPLPLGEVALHIPPQIFWGQHKAQLSKCQRSGWCSHPSQSQHNTKSPSQTYNKPQLLNVPTTPGHLPVSPLWKRALQEVVNLCQSLGQGRRERELFCGLAFAER